MVGLCGWSSATKLLCPIHAEFLSLRPVLAGTLLGVFSAASECAATTAIGVHPNPLRERSDAAQVLNRRPIAQSGAPHAVNQ